MGLEAEETERQKIVRADFIPFHLTKFVYFELLIFFSSLFFLSTKTRTRAPICDAREKRENDK